MHSLLYFELLQFGVLSSVPVTANIGRWGLSSYNSIAHLLKYLSWNRTNTLTQVKITKVYWSKKQYSFILRKYL